MGCSALPWVGVWTLHVWTLLCAAMFSLRPLLSAGVYAFGFLFMLPQLFVNYKVRQQGPGPIATLVPMSFCPYQPWLPCPCAHTDRGPRVPVPTPNTACMSLCPC